MSTSHATERKRHTHEHLRALASVLRITIFVAIIARISTARR
jgi:hypothetical protein